MSKRRSIGDGEGTLVEVVDEVNLPPYFLQDDCLTEGLSEKGNGKTSKEKFREERGIEEKEKSRVESEEIMQALMMSGWEGPLKVEDEGYKLKESC